MSAVGVALLIGASSANAATVKLGSSLPSSLVPGGFGTATLSQSTLPGATLVSPFNGRIVRWQIVGASGGPFLLRVIRPVGAGYLFTGAGTAVSGPITGPGVLTFQADLPIEAGDTIGMDAGAGSMLGASNAIPGYSYAGWSPALLDGETARAPSFTSGTRELGFNATVLANCVVPKVRGKTLKAARKLLARAGCATGKVKRPKRKALRRRSKRVVSQKPKPGTEVRGGTKVTLRLGANKRH